MPAQKLRNTTKEKLHEIIFEADTPAGKAFDVALLVAIVASVLVVILESVKEYQEQYGDFLYILEWIFTIFFTIEYILRLYSVYKPLKYSTSFFGIIDLLAILPTYLSLFISGTQTLLVIRILRLLRVFRIFKLGHFLIEGDVILRSLKASRAKITVFLFFILLMVTIIGSVMYIVEGGQENSGFTSIPRSIYWAIVTLTTVGYGDITPTTEIGQLLSALVMILGYAVLAVPTGIVSAEMIKTAKKTTTQACRYCGKDGHDDDAMHCKYCGQKLHPG
ncbi:MAG: ion transporter [Lewinellaceae bacterium]|nr:ion transporter [Saprospiraceae bacterium]MCB9337289.1 ion transporter [Lewinellaceae bacterium]